MYSGSHTAGNQTWKNISGKVDEKIQHYCTVLIQLRDDILACAAVTTEIAVLQMQDNVSTTTPDK
jgi:hypothetical protein